MGKNIKLLTIGADLEFPVCDHNSNIVSIEGKIGGSKGSPIKYVNGFSLQEDNVALEINFPVSESEDLLFNNLSLFRNTFLGSTSSFRNDFNLHILKSSVFYYKDEYISTKQAKTFGCEPDFNAYTGRPNIPPTAKKIGNLRTFGGHIHIGLDPVPSVYDAMEIVKLLDIFVSMYFPISNSHFLPEEINRRAYYGFAGSFRMKEYGIEYRTPSNTEFLCLPNIWEAVNFSINAFNGGTLVSKDHYEIINNAINTNVYKGIELTKLFNNYYEGAVHAINKEGLVSVSK